MSDYLDELDLTVSTLWREERVSCPHRDLLQAYLDQALPSEAQIYVTFHVEEIGCPFCAANLEDLRACASDDREARVVEQEDRLLRSTRTFLDQVRRPRD